MLLSEIPFAAIDLETTGLSPKSGARVVELAIARVEPGRQPTLVLDTLVDPQGPVLCTHIHGISDDDVVGAPMFLELVGDLVTAMDGALVGAFNASFDMSFVSAELALARPARQFRLPPHVCMMWMRPLLKMSARCNLSTACSQHGVATSLHRAAGDALACAHMWQHYVRAAEALGVRTIDDLSKAGTHKYLATLASPRYSAQDFLSLGGRRSTTAAKPRDDELAMVAPAHGGAAPAHGAMRQYWQSVSDALVDGVLDEAERHTLRGLQRSLNLPDDNIRAVHAGIFGDKLREFAEDDAVSRSESAKLSVLLGQLADIGWAPGLM